MSSHHVKLIHWSTRIAVSLNVGQKDTSEACSQLEFVTARFAGHFQGEIAMSDDRTEQLSTGSNAIKNGPTVPMVRCPDGLSKRPRRADGVLR